MIVIFHPEAYNEMFESARFFEEKDTGLGFDLIDAIEESIARIVKFPQSGTIERRNIRKCLVRGFPFTILYESHRDHIFIAAVMHQHRRPGYWAKRLK
jgi:ParE toxin of type II toxin-antitoxin system, parDE